MVRFLISTTEEMHTGFKRAADQRGQTLSGLIRQILWDWWEAHRTEQTSKDE